MKLMKFEADWCAPCKQQTMIMKGMDYEAVDIETDDGGSLAKLYGVGSIPTMVLVDEDGVEVQRWVGLTPRTRIQEALDVS